MARGRLPPHLLDVWTNGARGARVTTSPLHIVRDTPLGFDLSAVDPTGARAGLLHTRRGTVQTPAFMAVGTHAHVRHLSVDEVRHADAPIMLGNTYHLMLR